MNWEKPLFPAVSGGGPLPASLQGRPPSAPRTSGVSATAGRLCAQEGCISDAQTRWSLDRTARGEMMQGLRHVVPCPLSAAQGCPLVAGPGIACSGRLSNFELVLHHLPEPGGETEARLAPVGCDPGHRHPRVPLEAAGLCGVGGGVMLTSQAPLSLSWALCPQSHSPGPVGGPWELVARGPRPAHHLSGVRVCSCCSVCADGPSLCPFCPCPWPRTGSGCLWAMATWVADQSGLMPRGNETPHLLLSRTLAQEMQTPVTSLWGLGGEPGREQGSEMGWGRGQGEDAQFP